MSQSIRGHGGQLIFPIGPKNTNLVEDVEILLPIKFRWIPFSSFRREVENVWANQRPRRTSCFSDWPEKHKLGRGRWYVAFCQVSFNSVQRFQRRSRKCLSQSEATAAISVFPIGPKNTNLVEDVEILLPIKFRWIPFSSFRGEVENVSATAAILFLVTSKLNPLLRIDAIAQMVERRNDDLECWTMLVRARSLPLFLFQQCSLVCICLYRRRPTIRMIEA